MATSFYITSLVSISWIAGPFLLFYLLMFILRNAISFFYVKFHEDFRWQARLMFIVEGIFCVSLGVGLSLFIFYAIGLRVLHWGFTPLIFMLIWPFIIHSFREVESQTKRGIFEPISLRCPWIEHPVFSYPRSIAYGIKNRLIAFSVVTIVMVCATVLVVGFTYDLCLCQHPFDVSSRAIRLMSRPSCDANTICYSYLNLPEDGRSQMIVKFHTSSGTNASYVYYDTVTREK